MTSPAPAVMSWSGGKDSALALFRTLRDGTHEVRALITTVTREYDRISMHGIRRDLLEAQASSLGIPLTVSYIPSAASNAEYEAAMLGTLRAFRAGGIVDVICGDLFLQDIRDYRDRLFESVGMRGVYPLWLENTTELAREFIDLGFKSVVCSADPKRVPKSVAGSLFDDDLLASLPPECDPCAENGEFHTFVYDGPVFTIPVAIDVNGVVQRDDFLFADIVPSRPEK